MTADKEGLEFLSNQAVAAHTAVIKPAAEPEHVYYIREADGVLYKHEATVAPRRYSALSLNDLAQLYAEITTFPAEDVKAIAFVGGDKIEIVLAERAARRERLIFAMTITKAFSTLSQLHKSPIRFDQGDFIDLLRITLCGCVDKATIQLLRTLKNTKCEGGESTVKPSSKGMSRSVLMEASAGGGEIPEDIIVNAPIYEEFASGDGCKRYPIVCGLVMDMDYFTFTLIPMSGHLEQAFLAEQQRIAEELRFLVEKNNCRVVCGTAR